MDLLKGCTNTEAAKLTFLGQQAAAIITPLQDCCTAGIDPQQYDKRYQCVSWLFCHKYVIGTIEKVLQWFSYNTFRQVISVHPFNITSIVIHLFLT